MDTTSHGEGGRIGETVAEALSRLQPRKLQSVAEALAEVPAAPEERIADGVLRWWKPVAGLGAALALWIAAFALRDAAGSAPVAPAKLPVASDAAYLAEVGRDIEARCVTWQRQVHDAEALLTSANLEPVRISLRADDVFAGTRRRPRLFVEGALRDTDAPSPLRIASRNGLTVKKFHDRSKRGTVTRVIEATW